MIVISVNRSIFIVKENISILEACKSVGIEIPRFCYHETLSIAGNCRMCVVKLEDDDKLIISCLTEIQSEMDILTEDPVIQKAREDIVEFLLLDHPLDCPICDQGGECDLQDQARKYGASTSKYRFRRVDVIDKNFSPFIKSIMSRCIHCTRCVRFSSEIAGVDFFGTLNRGNATEIGTYTLNTFNSEISGNVIDLCPVGALTSKSYAFKARPWEISTVESIDLTDALGSNIYYNYTDDKVLRVLPKYNKEINETLISDKARYSYDSYYSFKDLLNIKVNNTNYRENFSKKEIGIFKVFKKAFHKEKTLIIVSEDLNYDNLNALKKIANIKKNIQICSSTKFENSFGYNQRNSNIFFNYSNSIKNVSQSLNNIFLLAINPRTEAALINTRLRFLIFNDYINVYNFGYNYNSNLKTFFLNFKISNLVKYLFKGKKMNLFFLLINNASPLLIFGNSLIERGFKINEIEFFLKNINPSIIFFKVYLYSNSIANSYLNIQSLNTKCISEATNLFFLKCRETNFLKRNIFNKSLLTSKVFWLNSFMLNNKIDNSIQYPIANDYEDSGLYINAEFRPQISNAFMSRKNNSYSYSEFLDKIMGESIPKQIIKSKFNSFCNELLKDPGAFTINEVNKNYLSNYHALNLSSSSYRIFSSYPVKPQILDFYKTNAFTDASKNMLNASIVFNKEKRNFF